MFLLNIISLQVQLFAAGAAAFVAVAAGSRRGSFCCRSNRCWQLLLVLN
jgi:hypothetical protein